MTYQQKLAHVHNELRIKELSNMSAVWRNDKYRAELQQRFETRLKLTGSYMNA